MTLQKIVSIIIKLVMLFMLFLYGSMFLGMFVSSLIEKNISENSASSFSIMGSAYPLTVVILAIAACAASDFIAKMIVRDQALELPIHTRLEPREIMVFCIAVLGVLMVINSLPSILDFFAKILLSKYPPLAREFSGYIKNTYVYMMPTAVIKLILGIVMIKSKRTISKWVMH